MLVRVSVWSPGLKKYVDHGEFEGQLGLPVGSALFEVGGVLCRQDSTFAVEVTDFRLHLVPLHSVSLIRPVTPADSLKKRGLAVVAVLTWKSDLGRYVERGEFEGRFDPAKVNSSTCFDLEGEHYRQDPSYAIDVAGRPRLHLVPMERVKLWLPAAPTSS